MHAHLHRRGHGHFLTRAPQIRTLSSVTLQLSVRAVWDPWVCSRGSSVAVFFSSLSAAISCCLCLLTGDDVFVAGWLVYRQADPWHLLWAGNWPRERCCPDILELYDLPVRSFWRRPESFLPTVKSGALCVWCVEGTFSVSDMRAVFRRVKISLKVDSVDVLG